MKKTFFSIRTVRAKNRKAAIRKVEEGDFDESHPLCDAVLPEDEFPYVDNQETLIEFTLLAGNELGMRGRGSRITDIYKEHGRGGLYTALIELTKEFHQFYKGFEWDGEFFDAIDQYWNEWANELPHVPIREQFKLN